jgi:signal transduction histidine kinase
MDDSRLFLFNEKTGTTNTYVEKNGKWSRVQTPLDSFKATVRYYNQQDGTYWLGGEKQLLHLNKDFQLIRSYTPKDGLPGDFDLLTFNTHSLTNAHYILSDNKNNIWFTTNSAIYELDVRQGKFYRLQDRDGFEKQVFTGSVPGKDQSGNLYFPGGFQYGQGFDKIIPDNLRKSYPPSIAYIQSLQVNQEQKILEEGPDGLAKLSLKYSENRLVIETGIIDFFSGGKSGIRYKIKELNDDWQYAPANYTIRYEGLQSGRYTLVMQASNALNEFIGPEKRVRFDIHPPFWKTWWAYTGYALLLIVGTWAFMHYRSRRLLRTNQLLEEKVTQRTKQLKKSLEELKATQTQLIQREKMASLGELTAGIAHEIQNPLNFVNNFSEVSEELVDELKEEIINGNKEEAICLTDDIKANLKKVVNHGKRADAIVKSMLEHSRTGDGQKEAIDINALADEYIRLAYHGMRAKDKAFHAHFTTDFDSTIDKIEVVPQEIGRVLLNLFNNAFYAVHQKKKQLNGTFEPVVSVRTQKKNGSLEILVEDNGNGIAQSDLKKLYNPFFTTKPTGEGTGLGLSLSYDIITKGHKGEMKVYTKEGEGATFIISLPINNRI